jgi:hypothetical protein
MRVNVNKLLEVLHKWKAKGYNDIDLVMLFNIARDLGTVTKSEYVKHITGYDEMIISSIRTTESCIAGNRRNWLHKINLEWKGLEPFRPAIILIGSIVLAALMLK